MKRTHPTRINSIVFALAIPLFLVFLAVGAENAPTGQETSEELLLKIMDLHSQLVTNDVFLAQAKMLGAYLEAAQPQEEAKKVKVYSKVLDILVKIKESKEQISIKPTQKEGVETEKKTLEGESKGKNVFEPGAALLEIFKLKGNEDSLENIPELPVIRTYWKRDLACSAAFLLPERLAEIGERSAYTGKFSFYYEAKQPGKYGFTILHHEDNGCVLKIGGVTVVEPPQETERRRRSYSFGGAIMHGGIPPVYQGVCNLEKGFHRVEFTLVSISFRSWGSDEGPATFQVKILTPDAFDAVPITKDMMLLKKE